MEFTKEKTNVAKGVAICLMFAHHLYAFPSRIENGSYYIPLIPTYDIEVRIGLFGGICVSMFLFLSGYGMFLGYSFSKQSPWQYSFKKLKDFYLVYWTYFLVFISTGFLFFKEVTLWKSDQIRYSPELSTFLGGFIGWSSHYNDEWWFVRTFMILLSTFCPFYLILAKKSPIFLLFISIILYVSFWLFYRDAYGIGGPLFWQIYLVLGLLFSKAKLFSSSYANFLDDLSGIWFFPVVFICFLIRHKAGTPQLDFLLLPIFIYSAIRAVGYLKLTKIFAYLGQYSFPLWLVHSFFCYYFFQDFIYFPRWSPLIFGLLMSFSLISVLLIEHLRSFIPNFSQSH